MVHGGWWWRVIYTSVACRVSRVQRAHPPHPHPPHNNTHTTFRSPPPAHPELVTAHTARIERGRFNISYMYMYVAQPEEFDSFGQNALGAGWGREDGFARLRHL